MTIKRLILLFILLATSISEAEDISNKNKIQEIAKVYSASMQYIFKNQTLINNQSRQKEALFGSNFISNVKSTYKQKFMTNTFPDENILAIKVLLEVMIEVMEDNRTLILDEDISFKGFIPAIFAFQISERYSKKGIGIIVKFTNEADRVRNKFNTPDPWEADAIKNIKQNKLAEYYDENGLYKGAKSSRYMIPVAMSAMCLTCHGTPKENPANFNIPRIEWTLLDKTGFPMENWKMSDFGGGISVTIYDAKTLGETY